MIIIILTRVIFSLYLLAMPFLFGKLLINKFYNKKRSINFLIPIFWIFMIFHEKGRNSLIKNLQ